MKKDFTKANEEHIIAIVKEVTADGFPEQFKDFFGDIWLSITGWFGKMDISKYLNDIDAYHRRVLDKNNTTIKQIRKIFNTVREDDTTHGTRQSFIRTQYYTPVVSYLEELNAMLDPNVSSVVAGMRAHKLNELREILRENKVSVTVNPVYSSDYGYYGGKQNGCIDKWLEEDVSKDEMRTIIHKYSPEYTDKDIRKFLNEMNSRGCHYMAAVNTLFALYIGREAEFEATFGFPMYDENGHVNSDLVMLDFYTREHKREGGHSSLGTDEINDQWKNYLKEKGIDVQVKQIDLDIDNYSKQAAKGEIIIVYSPLRLRNSSGKLVDTRDGCHGTVITGTEEIDGKTMYKVSSWGKEYWIDPDDYADVDGYPIYEQVIYK
ncbi:MAG: hypothetical protein IJH77_06530 [Mogibacterium sp.]|nr:hypothetical protein [Mogibacterium sp.]